jgi:peptidoglycan/LPS O-acetylase OafA/YrhL
MRSAAVERRHADNNFDLLRLLAAFEVAVGHSCTWLRVPLPPIVQELFRCFPGVAVFFVISGFLITRSYVDRNRGVASYFLHRALRIYPALWLQYLFVIMLMAATGGFALGTVGESRFWSWLAAAGFVGSNFWASVLTNFNPFSWEGLYKWYPADVLWTIPVEVGFYLLVPIVFAPALVRRGWAAPLAILLFSVSVGIAYYAGPLLRDYGNLNSTGMLHSSPGPYFWLFVAGGLVAFFWPRVSWLFEGQIGWWLAVCVVASFANWSLKGTIALPYRTPDELTVPRGLILVGLVIALAHSYTLLSRWMRGVDLSYGLYLFHLPFPFGLYYAGIGGEAWLVVASLAIAFALAGLSWVLVERPALALKSRFERRGAQIVMPRSQSRPGNPPAA